MHALVLVALATLAATAPVPARGIHVFVEGYGSQASHKMDDVNGSIESINAALALQGISMGRIRSGSGLGAGGGLEFNGRWAIGLGYERLFASSYSGIPILRLRYDVPANALRVFGEWRPLTFGSVTPCLGLGVGRMNEVGAITVEAAKAEPDRQEFDGSGPLFEGYGGADLWSAEHFVMRAVAGYRYARVNEVRMGGQTLMNPDGSRFRIDYGGVIWRVGIRLLDH